MAVKSLIETVTFDGSGASGVSFLNIPQDGSDLLLVVSVRTAEENFEGNLNVGGAQVGTSNKALRLFGTGSATGSDQYTLGSLPGQWVNGNTSTANTFSNGSYYISNYTSSSQKSVSMDSVTENNATGVKLGITAGLIDYAFPITSVEIGAGGSFQEYTTFSLYKIKYD